LIYQGVRVDPPGVFAFLEEIFNEGCPWFRQSVIYTLFHIIGKAPQVEDKWLDRYTALAEEFFNANSWKMKTSVANYNFAGHLGWPEIVAEQHRPGTGPRIIPRLFEAAVRAKDQEQIDGLFKAVDTIAFAYRRTHLALMLLERAAALGGASIEERVLKSLATVRLQDQSLLDALLEQHPNLSRLRRHAESIEPSIREEDLPTLLDGLTVQLILTSDYFRGRVCDAFRRAATARSARQFLVQILEWMRDEFMHMTP
jgi:hypothetical protein